MKTLELKHVAHYLEHGLKGFCTKKTINKITVANKIFIIDSIINTNQFKYWTYDKSFVSQFNFLGKGFRSCDFKLILRPLSDLNNPIEHNGKNFVPMDKLNNIDTTNLHGCCVASELLYKWHFDVHGLIDAGLAVDVNTLETNPYK